MIVAGPLSAAWDREGSEHEAWSRHLPVLVSLTSIVTLLTFMTQYASPYSGLSVSAPGAPMEVTGRFAGGTSITLERVRTLAELRGLFGLILQAAILSGAALLLLRRGLLRAGDLSFLFTANAVAMLLMRGNLLAFTPLIVVALASGLLGDLVLAVLRPSSVRRWPLRLLAFAMPACYTTGFFVYVLTLGGTWWELPDVTGTIVLTGFVGLLLSYLVVAPIPIRLGGAARS